MRRFGRRLILATIVIAGACLAIGFGHGLAQGRMPWSLYTVGWGDTLDAIAETHGTGAASIAQANGLVPDAILPVGRRLIVPGPSPRPATPSHWATHVVHPGETATTIAAAYHVSPWHILVANRLKPNAPLAAGTQLIIPTKPHRPAIALPSPTHRPGQQPFRYAANVQLLGQDHRAVLQGIRGIGFDWLRQEVRWAAIEQRDGIYDWAELDRLVADASAAGIKVLLQVGGFPPEEPPRQGDALTLTEADMQHYADFLGRMAARYRGQVQAYEIWDPPNAAPIWGGNGLMPASEYVRLLRSAYGAIKAADSQATIVTAALIPTGSHNPREAIEPEIYLEQMYQAGAKGNFDAVGAQSWGYNNPPADDPTRSTADSTTFKGDWHLYFRSFELLYPIMQKHGDGAKQIWLVKFGWASSEVALPGMEYAADNTEQEQALYLADAYAIGRARPYMGLMAFWNFNFAPQVAADDVRAAYSIMRRDNTARLAMETLAIMPK